MVRNPTNWWRPHAWAIAGYLLVSLLFSWPLPLHFGTHLPGSPAGDTGVYVWNLWVFQHELIDHRTTPYFTGTIFAATGRANLSLHNYTAFANILALPLVRFLGVVATFNIVYLILTVLTAYAMFYLARRFTENDHVVAWLAGLLFAWSPVLVTRGMGHFSLVAAAPLPIFVLLLLRVRERQTVADAVWLGATVAWATSCDVYYGVFCVMMAIAYFLAMSFRVVRSNSEMTTRRLVLLRGIDLVAICVSGLVLALLFSNGWEFTLMGRVVRMHTLYTPILALALLLAIRLTLSYRPALKVASGPRMVSSLRLFASAALVSAILMSPLLYAYGVRIQDGRAVNPRTFWRSSPPGVDLLAMVTPNPNHPAAPPELRKWVARLTRDGYLENVASLSFVALVVVLVARGRGWHAPPLALAIALGFGLLALGPFLRVAGVDTHVPAPWAFLRYVPIVGLARSPSRFFVLAMLGLALLFASALHALMARVPQARRPLLASIAVLLAAELLPAPRPLFSAEIPSIYRVVANDPRQDVRVLELPFGVRDGTMALGNFTSRTQFYQTAHGKAIVGGYLSRVSRRRIRENERDPVLSALARLSEGKQLSPGQGEELQRHWPAFVKRTSIGYIVVDEIRASEELRSLASASLGLERIAEHEPLTLYRPASAYR